MEMNHEFLLFKELLYIRRVEEKIVELYPEQEMRCPIHLSIGQEAIAVGVCKNLEKEDLVFSNHRSHAHYLAKKGDLNKFFAEIYGCFAGCCKGRGGSMHLVDLSVGFVCSTPIVAGTIPLAVGAAFNFFYKNIDNHIAVVFFGDGATEEGVFQESINFAKLKNLPILFVCENNLYSVYTHLRERQPERKISDLVKAHGLEVCEADGNNVVEVYDKSKKLIEKIKKSGGPAFMELTTYRWREHCGPNYDNNLGYRTEKEFLEFKSKDPLKRMEEKLLCEGTIKEEDIKKCEEEINYKINIAVNLAKKSFLPGEEELEKHVYSD